MLGQRGRDTNKLNITEKIQFGEKVSRRREESERRIIQLLKLLAIAHERLQKALSKDGAH